MALANDYDVILLDWMLPGLSGIDVCRQLRKQNVAVPVIFLTARDAVQDTVFGLDAGANDYIKKPLQFDELLARIRVQLRSTPGGGPGPPLRRHRAESRNAPGSAGRDRTSPSRRRNSPSSSFSCATKGRCARAPASSSMSGTSISTPTRPSSTCTSITCGRSLTGDATRAASRRCAVSGTRSATRPRREPPRPDRPVLRLRDGTPRGGALPRPLRRHVPDRVRAHGRRPGAPSSGRSTTASSC